MRYAVILAACGLLCGCYAVEDLQNQTSDLFKTNAEIRARNEAVDSAACKRLGATPGTDIYVQCMIGRGQIRATNAAAASAARDAEFSRQQAAGRAINPGAYSNQPLR